METIDEFRHLFRGRTDIWGAVHGECVKRELTWLDWENHLYGDGSLGIYPLVSGKVAWGCTDIDDGYEQSWPMARNLQKTLELLGITSWIELTKSKGFHVWVFVDGWVDSQDMRNCLLAAHQVAGVAPTEVNPKSVEGGSGGNGNYVNLPYAHGWVSQGRRVVWHGVQLGLDEWVDAAGNGMTPPQVIREAAKLYKAPPKVSMYVDIQPCDNEQLQGIVARLGGLAYKIFQEGPLDGRDRSGTLMRVAHLMGEQGGFTAKEAFAILWDADGRWGKFHDRADGIEQIQTMVAKAWAAHNLTA